MESVSTAKWRERRFAYSILKGGPIVFNIPLIKKQWPDHTISPTPRNKRFLEKHLLDLSFFTRFNT